METENGHGKLIKMAMVAQTFTPAAPIDNAALFSERPDQIMASINALFQKGLHVALFGERGVGKTSLANVLPEMIKGTQLPHLDAVHVDCNTNDDYRSIWRKVFREIEGQRNDDDLFDGLSGPDPEDVRFRLQRLQGRMLIVIDELDRVEDNEALSLLADTVKTLSDHAVDATLMFVGVANSVENLLGEHESIVRSLVQVAMPRMSDSELGSILDGGFTRVDMSIASEARDRIVRTAEGLPHYAHLLGLHAGQAAVQDDRAEVHVGDVERAEVIAVDTHSIRSEYDQATASPQRGHLFEEVLLACAFTPKSEFGYFRPGDVREPLSMVMDREMKVANYQRHLNELAKPARGPALYKDGEPRHYIYRFRDPLLQPFVKLVGRTKQIVEPEVERELEARQERLGSPTLFEQTSEL